MLTEKEEEEALAVAERQSLAGGQVQTVQQLLEEGDISLPPLVILWR